MPTKKARRLEQRIDRWLAASTANRARTFDDRVAQLEGLCRLDFEPAGEAERGSRAWDVRAILIQIKEYREAVALGVMDDALTHGAAAFALAAGSNARHARPGVSEQTRRAAQQWLEFRAKQRDRAITGNETKRDTNARPDEALMADVRTQRAKHPGLSEWSVARLILKHIDDGLLEDQKPISDGDEKQRIDRVRQRIRYREKTK
jgi:hypothetical protein